MGVERGDRLSWLQCITSGHCMALFVERLFVYCVPFSDDPLLEVPLYCFLSNNYNNNDMNDSMKGMLARVTIYSNQITVIVG